MACLSLALAACSGEPRPEEDLAHAKSLIKQSDTANVQHYAAAELSEARDKLQQAEQADAGENKDLARRSANEAAADAELAEALARSRAAEHALEDQKKSTEALRQEAKQHVPENL